MTEPELRPGNLVPRPMLITIILYRPFDMVHLFPDNLKHYHYNMLKFICIIHIHTLTHYIDIYMIMLLFSIDKIHIVNIRLL